MSRLYHKYTWGYYVRAQSRQLVYKREWVVGEGEGEGEGERQGEGTSAHRPHPCHPPCVIALLWLSSVW